mgnify:CR=1 FL=1
MAGPIFGFGLEEMVFWRWDIRLKVLALLVLAQWCGGIVWEEAGRVRR